VEKEYVWSVQDFPLIVRAMAMTPTLLVVAGPEDIAQKSANQMTYDNDEEAYAAYTGKRGAELYLVSVADGKILQKRSLPAMPVFDGLIVADQSVFVSTRDGRVVCLSGVQQ
jgi:hypothetical protein